jgi:hypothetical protein
MQIGHLAQASEFANEHLQHLNRVVERAGRIATKGAPIILPLSFDRLDRDLIDFPHHRLMLHAITENMLAITDDVRVGDP